MVSSGARSMAETRSRRTGRQDFPRRGEIFLTALDPALGHEIKKTRPALVIQNDVTNRYGMTTLVATITSKVSEPPYPNEVTFGTRVLPRRFKLPDEPSFRTYLRKEVVSRPRTAK